MTIDLKKLLLVFPVFNCHALARAESLTIDNYQFLLPTIAVLQVQCPMH